MGRYAERVEDIGRLLRAIGQRLAESDPTHLATLKVLMLLSNRARLHEPSAKKSPAALTPEWVITTVTDANVPNGIPASISRLYYCATQLRERMSVDHWRTVQRLAHVHEESAQSLDGAMATLDRVMPACTALAGYAFDDMTRDDAWRFLVLGRQLERMAFLSSVTNVVLGLSEDDCEAVLGALLEIGNVSMTYRARYQRQPELLPVLDLLVLDDLNPHSICFQLQALVNHLRLVKERFGFQPINDPTSLLQALRGFDLAELENLQVLQHGPLAALLAACERCAYGLSDEITQRFFIHAGERPQTSVAA